jgi:hypothetical protein
MSLESKLWAGGVAACLLTCGCTGKPELESDAGAQQPSPPVAKEVLVDAGASKPVRQARRAPHPLVQRQLATLESLQMAMTTGNLQLLTATTSTSATLVNMPKPHAFCLRIDGPAVRLMSVENERLEAAIAAQLVAVGMLEPSNPAESLLVCKVVTRWESGTGDFDYDLWLENIEVVLNEPAHDAEPAIRLPIAATTWRGQPVTGFSALWNAEKKLAESAAEAVNEFRASYVSAND